MTETDINLKKFALSKTVELLKETKYDVLNESEIIKVAERFYNWLKEQDETR